VISVSGRHVSLIHSLRRCPKCQPYIATLGAIGDTEAIAIAYCTKSGRGARTIPNGALAGVHFVKTPEYVQVTGVGDLTKLNIPQGDEGGELDNRGADGAFCFFSSRCECS